MCWLSLLTVAVRVKKYQEGAFGPPKQYVGWAEQHEARPAVSVLLWASPGFCRVDPSYARLPTRNGVISITGRR